MTNQQHPVYSNFAHKRHYIQRKGCKPYKYSNEIKNALKTIYKGKRKMYKQLLFSDGKLSNYIPLSSILIVSFIDDGVGIRFTNGEVAEYLDLVENAEAQYADFLWDKNPILVLKR